MENKYYLGLDMGTSSVGWALTDSSYNLLRIKGKDAWGVRLFPEAETAASRRSYRTSRRRLSRERARIAFLRDIFSEEIEKVDPGFYQRLDDSKYFCEDKTTPQRFTLFTGDGFTDKEYYELYPTIFHLRSALINSVEDKDVRLVFLAILHIFKHRGHFLNANLSGNGIRNLSELYNELCNHTRLFPEMQDTSELGEILCSRSISNSKRYESLLSVLNLQKKSAEGEMVKFICGLKGQLSKAFPDEIYDEDHAKLSVSFREGNYDEKEIDLMSFLSEENYEIFLLLKEIHDWGLVANIMQGEKYLSSARVKSFEKHAADLKCLKEVYKKYAKGHYNKMFRVMEDNNYSSYVGSVNSEKEQGKVRRGAKNKTEDFFKRIQKDVSKMLEEHPSDRDLEYILDEISKESFLPKQLTSSNGVIPYQLHLRELKKILENARQYLPFLNDKDATGLTKAEKIIEIFSFQIPYYIGPLYNDGKHTAWVKRLAPGKVYPWNFNTKIDVKASSEEFINRMVRQCSYLNGQTVLPKASLLYEKYMVLNELNNLKVNGNDITPCLKQQLFKELFMKKKKVTGKDIKNYLRVSGFPSDAELSGIDGDFHSSLSSYRKFQEILDTEVLTAAQERMVEDVIFWSTVYGESKSFLKEKIKEKYSDSLTDVQIKRILGIKFREWGRLSKSFLELEGADRDTGEIKTIISRMWEENINLMECLSDHYTYSDTIRSQAADINKLFTDLEYEDFDELYLSAPVKRMIWQTVVIVKELCGLIGNPPAKIFIEMARDVDGKNVKERKDSRKAMFAALYKSCKEDGRDWSREIAETEDVHFRSKKLYLYYTQKGRCMYTGETIDLGDLFNDNLYDIDHIYPRHFVKDDSIENNLVLVKKQVNNHKSDTYPIEQKIRSSQYSWWKMLLEGKFITKEKFDRLTRSTGFTIEEQAAFINRQIVETRQGTKAIAQIFEKTLPDSRIVYSKAGNVSDFRNKYDCLKCRELNNLHHAHDAYLNIVVGNVYDVKFTKNPINYVKEYVRDPQKYAYHLDKMFMFPVSRGDEIAWVTENDQSLKTVKNVMKKQSPLVTRMSYEEHGGLADQTIYSAKEALKAKGIGYVPIKTSDEKLKDVSKYGGFKKYTGTYFFLVEYEQNGKKVRTLEAMPLYLKDQLNSVEKMEQYCKEILGYSNSLIIVKKIKMYSLIRVNGYNLYLTGRSGNRLVGSNAVELKLDYEFIKHVKKISKLTDFNKDNSELAEEINPDQNIKLYDCLSDKFNKGIYQFRPNPVGEKMIEGRNKFKELTIARQCYVLQQIIHLSGGENQGADLRDIGGAKNAGIVKFNKKISDAKEFKLLHVSATGLIRREVDLLKI